MERPSGEPPRNSIHHVTRVRELAFLAALLLALLPALYAEEGKTIRVCIPEHKANSALLHQVQTTLSSHKPDKSTHTRVVGVQLANLDQILDTDNPYKGNLAKQSLTPEALDRARQDQCDYVLVVSLPDVKTARSSQPNPSFPDQQVTTNTGDPYMRKQDPDNYVQIKYRLYRMDPAPASYDGFVTTHDAAPPQAVVSAALDMLANQVFTKVTK